jgi:LysM repeat protein
MPGLTLWLVLGVLLLPTCGALVARALERRTESRAVQIVAVLGFAGAVACLVALQWTPLNAATLGRMTIFLPSSDVLVAQESFVEIPTAAPTTRIVTATAIPTRAATTTPTTTSTAAPTATTAPTATPPPPPTEIPPTEVPPPPATEAPPPAPTSRPAQARRYVVESGDTLRGIAERFDVSVGAILRYNGLTEEDGDNLRPGQELLIPPS